MKSIFVILILTFCHSLILFGQENYSKEEITLDDLNKYSLIIRNKNRQIIYSGTFDLPQSLPIGTHFYYDQNGRIKELIEYSFSGEHFEGVPIVVQKTYLFDKEQKLEKVIQAERCTECEYSPTGIWKFYKNGKLTKSINTNKVSNLEHKEYETYWDLLKNCK